MPITAPWLPRLDLSHPQWYTILNVTYGQQVFVAAWLELQAGLGWQHLFTTPENWMQNTTHFPYEEKQELQSWIIRITVC